MVTQDQSNQNPETSKLKTQDENSVTVISTDQNQSKTKLQETDVESQISTDLKQEIVMLVHGNLPAIVTKKKKSAKTEEFADQKELVVKPKKKKAKSVKTETDQDENDVIEGQSVQATEPENVLAKPKKKKSEKSQISKIEKNDILLLIKDNASTKSKAVMEDEDNELIDSGEEDIHYEDQNKQELVELLEEIVLERDVAKIKTQIAKIKSAFYQRNKEEIEKEKQDFIAEGNNAEEFVHAEDPLEQRFNTAFGLYRHNKANFAETLEKQKLENLQRKLQILEELKELINSEETLKKTYDEFKKLQDTWKEIGLVPATELNNLWQNYHFLVERFFDKVRINKELRDLDLKKNLELKVVLCEKAEELIVEKSILRSFKLLQKYHDEWREIGPVPSDEKEEIWERFKIASDKINQRRKEYYKTLQDEQQTNYSAKIALCEKAEELLEQSVNTFNDWQKKTKELNGIFKVWKTIGRAPKNQNDEVWDRFKVSLDGFFENKRDFLGKLKDQQMNNLNMKIDLCAQAENLKDSDDWKNTTNDLIRLQNDWKKIGPVPRRHSEKIWNRFRTACDQFFNKKSEYFKNIHVVEDDNLKKKRDLIKIITEFKVLGERETDLSALKDFQRQWMEIGHVPFKVKDELQHQYREAVDKMIDKMDINKSELNRTGYQSKVDVMKNAPDGGRRLSKERYGLVTRANKIKEDVALWENNIGFFANSKQSALLKREFELKIEKAKKEIKDIEAQIHILDKE